MISRIIAFVQARLLTAIIVAVLVLGIFGLVSYNRSNQKALEATLANGTPAAQDAVVEGLVENGRLADVLINTQNPDEDVDSPANQNSLDIRKHAVASVNRLSAEKKIMPADTFDTLFLICKDTNADVKATAETGLKALGSQSPSNLSAVVQRLSNGDPDIRSAAVDVLGLIGGSGAASAVDTVLLDATAQDAAISALQKIGAPSVPLVIAHLEDPKFQTDLVFRQQMVSLLDQITAPSSVPQLITLAGKSDQPSVQRLAQVALADTVLAAHNQVQIDKDAVTAAKDAAAKTTAQTTLTHDIAALPAVQAAEPTLIGILSNMNAASESRSQAALALGQSGTPTAIAALVTSLGDIDAQVRDASETGIQSSGAPAVGPLTATVTQGLTVARTGAAQALGGIGTPSAVAALNSVFQNPSTPEAVREGAMVGLGRSGNPSVIPTLVQALGDSDGAVAEAAQTGLLTPALARPAIPRLVAALSQPTPVPFNASETLSRMGALAESDVVPLLTHAAQTGNAPTQTWAAVTLGEIGSKSPAVMTALQGLSKSADPHVQYAASQSLLRLAGA